jgi:hypothetical protein
LSTKNKAYLSRAKPSRSKISVVFTRQRLQTKNKRYFRSGSLAARREGLHAARLSLPPRRTGSAALPLGPLPRRTRVSPTLITPIGSDRIELAGFPRLLLYQLGFSKELIEALRHLGIAV